MRVKSIHIQLFAYNDYTDITHGRDVEFSSR